MLSTREIESKDIKNLLDYWYTRTDYQMKIMGADINKMPSREVFKNNLELQLSQKYNEKKNFTCIWQIDKESIGHNNVNRIVFGDHAYMHLHIWETANRRSGLGLKLLKLTIPIFFEKLELNTLYCEPFSKNTAPNQTLKKLGFKFEKKYITIPGSINYEQEVNRWSLTLNDLKKSEHD